MKAVTLPEPLRHALREAARDNTIRIAYSGGLDSRFLAFCAKLEGFRVILLHVSGPHFATEETREAMRYARDMGLELHVIPINPLESLDLASLGTERCYACKRLLFSRLLALDPTHPLCDGSNASDACVFRPGGRAIKELKIHSPLAQAGLTKAQIRELGAQLGLPDPQQAARPCLLTRFPYGVAVSPEQLDLLARVERWINQTHPALAFRVRYPDGCRPELHIQTRSACEFSDDMLLTLREQLVQTFPAMQNVQIRLLDTLSGFFDRQKTQNPADA